MQNKERSIFFELYCLVVSLQLLLIFSFNKKLVFSFFLSMRIVQMGTTWVEHRVFALSMQMYGNVKQYVMNMLGVAMMVEIAEKYKLGLLPNNHWKRYFLKCNIAVSIILYFLFISILCLLPFAFISMGIILTSFFQAIP